MRGGSRGEEAGMGVWRSHTGLQSPGKLSPSCRALWVPAGPLELCELEAGRWACLDGTWEGT